jgi:hypothetical protein
MEADATGAAQRVIRGLGALGLACASACPVVAADQQQLRAGMWEFSRTVEGPASGGKAVTMASKKCTDPAAEMKQRREGLTKQGCKFSPGRNSGKTVEFEAVCPMGGTTITSKSRMTIESDSSYTIEITSSAPGGAGTKEKLVAKRVGDC